MKTNTLSLLAYKIAPSMFDISSGLVHVSLRDQLIRGTTLVRDLISTQQLDGAYGDILVVGAGAGGVAAALAAMVKRRRVLVIDTGDTPFRLQRNGTTRYVGPYMYEWPSPIYNDQHLPPDAKSQLGAWASKLNYAGLTIPCTAPVTADQLAKHWDRELQNALQAHPSLTLLTQVNEGASKGEIVRWVKDAPRWHRRRPPKLTFYGNNWLTGKPTTEHINPRFVILAAGLGPERTTWSGNNGKTLPGIEFWKPDALRDPNCGLAAHSGLPRVVVLGGGDGALQDTLRCLMIKEPLDSIAKLNQNQTVSAAIDKTITEILLIEQQHSLVRTWTNGAKDDEYDMLQEAYLRVVTPLAHISAVQSSVFDLLRTDVDAVDLVVKENSLGKAYALNRFLVLLIDECYKNSHYHPPPGRPAFRLHFNTELVNFGPWIGPRRDLTIKHRNSPTSSTLNDVSNIVIRFGVEGQLPGQLIGITKKDSENRGELSLIPQPPWLYG